MDQDDCGTVGFDRRTAAAYVVDDDLLDEYAISQPHLAEAWLRARQQSHEKGWRWSYELAEVGRTFAAVGQPEGFGAAASEVFATSSNEDLPGRRWTLAGSTHSVGIVKLFENACGAVDVSGRCGER